MATGKSTVWQTLVNVLNHRLIVSANPLSGMSSNANTFQRLSIKFRKFACKREEENYPDIPANVYDQLASSSLIDEDMDDELRDSACSTVVAEHHFPLAESLQTIPEWTNQMIDAGSNIWLWMIIDTAEHSTDRSYALQETRLYKWMHNHPGNTLLCIPYRQDYVLKLII